MKNSSASGSRKRKRNRNRKNRSGKHFRDANSFLQETFYSIVPSEDEEDTRNELIEKVRNLIKKRFRSSDIFVYGSYASLTALSQSDIDIGLKIETRNAEQTISQVRAILQANRFNNVQWARTKLPVNKKNEELFLCHGQDRESKIFVDLSLNNAIAPFASSFVRAVADFNITNRMFLVLVKYFARCRSLNEVSNGTLSNIGHSYLGILFLMMKKACPPFLKKENITEVDELVTESNGYEIVSDSFVRPLSVPNLDNLLLGFFTYYSKDNLFKNMAISLREGCLVSKESLGWSANEERYSLGIVDPFSGDNVGSSVRVRGVKKI